MADFNRIEDALRQVQALAQQGAVDAAAALCREIIQFAPQRAEAHFYLGNLHMRAGRNADAEASLRRAVDLSPGQPAFWSDLSIVQNRQGRGADAETSARQAVTLVPNAAAPWLSLANALFGQRRWAEAAEAFRQSLIYDANNAAAWNNLAAALQKLGDLPAAQQAYERSLALAPNHLGAQCNYACLLSERGEHSRATELLRAALANTPPRIDAYLVLGFVFQRLGEWALAEEAYRTAFKLGPRHREVRYNLALVLQQRWSLPEAEALIRAVLADDPSYADGWALLSSIQQCLSQMDESRASLQRSVSLAPNPHRHTRLLLNLQYADTAEPLALLEAHREWDAIYAAQLTQLPPVDFSGRGKNRPLRLGFVSADFGRHPTGFLVLPALEHLDKARCSVHCYTDRLHEDEYTARFRAAADSWRMTLDLSPQEIAEQIRRDEIDVLVDLMGHTAKNQLLVFAHKPAPIQFTWFGYVGTTGLRAIDYLLADRFHVRPGEEKAYVETVLRLPNCYACYGPPANAPEVSPLPAASAGHVTFGCFNSPAKFSRRTFDAWAQILNRVPAARLLLKYGALDQSDFQAWMRERFRERGIDPARITLEGWSEHAELLAAYHRVDIALDTQPYSGGLTTCEALWMGVPVITYPGQTFAGRHATSYLANSGLEHFVAADAAGYIELAVQWAARIEELSALRREMRDRLRRSPVCDAPRFAEDLLSLITDTVTAVCR